MPKILIINGPNLNMLGKREPEIYGDKTLEDLVKYLSDTFKGKTDLVFYQSNIEGELVSRIQQADEEKFDGVIMNPGAYTHYSLALHDAVKSINIPVIEVHISNIYAREEARHTSVIAPAAIGQISGFNFKSYVLAINYFLI
ncbi:MAG: type II 3-dehydroquinate dehydratase [Candidatus Margulisbacteria bacterium GWF2_35_9]|nr:MAG: type II 3-dehydroquinate dehydratase [Candidatus Margulisbacteria bacterium GWF2_35_9]